MDYCAILTNIFLVSHILLLFHPPKGSINKLQNMRNSEIFPILPSAPYDNNYKKHTYVRNCMTFIKKFTKKASFDTDWVHMDR